uniref:Uncharacterized protein n=1 Tax=Arundo donax TaxID=35708 RepID=A0A0A9HN81_ARUDO
MASPLGSST